MYSVANYRPHLTHFWANDFLYVFTLEVPTYPSQSSREMRPHPTGTSPVAHYQEVLPQRVDRGFEPRARDCKYIWLAFQLYQHSNGVLCSALQLSEQYLQRKAVHCSSLK